MATILPCVVFLDSFSRVCQRYCRRGRARPPGRRIDTEHNCSHNAPHAPRRRRGRPCARRLRRMRSRFGRGLRQTRPPGDGAGRCGTEVQVGGLAPRCRIDAPGIDPRGHPAHWSRALVLSSVRTTFAPVRLRTMTPYRVPSPSPKPEPVATDRHGGNDVFGVFFWAIVAIVGLAMAHDAGSSQVTSSVHDGGP